MKIEIELHGSDFKYKGIEIWAYELDGSFYRIDSFNKNFIKLSAAIKFIDERENETT